MIVPIKTHRLMLLSTLRPCGVWLIILLSLALAQPLLGIASHAPDIASRQIEFTAPDFVVDLLDDLVEHSSNAKQSLLGPGSELISSHLVWDGLFPPGRPDYLQITITSPWLTQCHPLSLPRPPPHS